MNCLIYLFLRPLSVYHAVVAHEVSHAGISQESVNTNLSEGVSIRGSENASTRESRADTSTIGDASGLANCRCQIAYSAVIGGFRIQRVLAYLDRFYTCLHKAFAPCFIDFYRCRVILRT